MKPRSMGPPNRTPIVPTHERVACEKRQTKDEQMVEPLDHYHETEGRKHEASVNRTTEPDAHRNNPQTGCF